ncbi:hypothetical protein SOPP22_12800 [Shewanella sp. OPT22]|nr:hypothetical protein SOPP22_12800 [Shewanella sp. OPT22]
MKISIVVLFAITSFPVLAQNAYLCSNGHAKRKVEVVYKGQNAKVPCDVQYTKSGSAAIVWSASHQVGYCESKAQSFKSKLESLGWQCSQKK